MKPTNHRDEHVDVKISAAGRAALKQAEAEHFASTDETRPITYARYLVLEADLRRPSKDF